MCQTNANTLLRSMLHEHWHEKHYAAQNGEVFSRGIWRESFALHACSHVLRHRLDHTGCEQGTRGHGCIAQHLVHKMPYSLLRSCLIASWILCARQEPLVPPCTRTWAHAEDEGPGAVGVLVGVRRGAVARPQRQRRAVPPQLQACAYAP